MKHKFKVKGDVINCTISAHVEVVCTVMYNGKIKTYTTTLSIPNDVWVITKVVYDPNTDKTTVTLKDKKV